MEINLETEEWFLNKFLPYMGPGSVNVTDNVSYRSTVFDKAPNKEPSNSSLALQKQCASLCNSDTIRIAGIGGEEPYRSTIFMNSRTLAEWYVHHLDVDTNRGLRAREKHFGV
jgi:hypothetical protein